MPVARFTTGGMETHIRLQDWLDANGVRQSALADRCGYDRGNFNRILRGTVTPTLHLAAAIERETGGTIKAVEWVA